MADPEVDHGFAYDEYGQIGILQSPFFDPGFGFDFTVEEYVERILYTLANVVEEQLSSAPWQITGRYTPPPPTTFSWIKAIGVATIIVASFSVLKASFC
ncbi:hypothetical protein IEQ34_006353 [Dendrobium chrysotoxum]|uniref:Uncharacterized protein n=1 Tax=Dendrobium chrysotoxum TaxID=161865 RepID=A0AAV7HFP3_DENCH|nr:hypothetical protein IEQ34_006353 [Dendrobium chrysotoxum]